MASTGGREKAQANTKRHKIVTFGASTEGIGKDTLIGAVTGTFAQQRDENLDEDDDLSISILRRKLKQPQVSVHRSRPAKKHRITKLVKAATTVDMCAYQPYLAPTLSTKPPTAHDNGQHSYSFVGSSHSGVKRSEIVRKLGASAAALVTFQEYFCGASGSETVTQNTIAHHAPRLHLVGAVVEAFDELLDIWVRVKIVRHIKDLQ